MRHRLIGLLAIATAVAGCSSGGRSDTDPTAQTSTVPSVASKGRPVVSGSARTAAGPSAPVGATDFATPAAVVRGLAAKRVQCTSFERQTLSPNDSTYLARAATCVVGSEKVAVATFSAAKQRARYLAIGLQGTGAYPHFVLGSTWAVATLTSATAMKIQRAIGGKSY